MQATAAFANPIKFCEIPSHRARPRRKTSTSTLSHSRSPVRLRAVLLADRRQRVLLEVPADRRVAGARPVVARHVALQRERC